MVAGKEGENRRRQDMRGRAADALDTARERTLSAYEAARERTSDVGRQVGSQLAIYPVGAVIGGLALGALLGALLPRTRREDELFGPTGRRLAGAAREAAEKGIDAGRDRIERFTGKVVTEVGSAVKEAVGEKS